MDIILHNLEHGLTITVFVFVMMLFIDYLNVLTKGKMSVIIKGGPFKQYTLTSFLGVIPGCLGAFMNVSFYVRGLISFGAIVGGMIATSGDEAFVMLAMFPGKALLLFGILFVLGIFSAYIVDKLVLILKIKPCKTCQFSGVHPEHECKYLNIKDIFESLKNMSFVRFLLLTLLLGTLSALILGIIGPALWDWERITLVSLLSLASLIVVTVPDHYLEEHIWKHIAKKHLWRVFLWSFCALTIVDIGLRFWNLEAFIQGHMIWVLLIASLLAIIPESGPHLIFVMMFSKGLIPFSVLLASSIIQDGHGMLPLMSYTIKDSLLIKLFNLLIGLGIGYALYSLGF